MPAWQRREEVAEGEEEEGAGVVGDAEEAR